MKKFSNNIVKCLSVLLGVALIVVSCDDPYEDSMYVNDDNLPPLALTMEADTAAGEWVEVLKYADLYSALNYAVDAFTVLLPTNEALQQFYAAKGVTSIQELGKEYARDLVFTHTIQDSLKVDDIIKKTELVNLANEELFVNIDTTDAGSFQFTNPALTSIVSVVESELPAYNGYIYRVDGVLDPLNESVYDLLKKGGKTGDANRFSIMSQAMQATGWADSLDVIQDTIWYNSGAYEINRRYYTLLAVADETYQKDGIGSFDALVAKLEAGTDYTSKDNELNKYVAYHILNNSVDYFELIGSLVIVDENEETGELFFSGDSVMLIDTKAENLVLQLNRKGDVNSMTFVFNASDNAASLMPFDFQYLNVMAKNGYLHEVDGYLPVWEPEPSAVTWDLADYTEVRNIVPSTDYKPSNPTSAENRYSVNSAKCYEFEVGASGSVNDQYSAITYVTCKSSHKKANNLDRLAFNLGYLGWVQMETPTLIRGKYRVELDIVYLTNQSFMRIISEGSNGSLIKVSVDGENEIKRTPYATITSSSANVYSTVLYEEIDFETTSSHLMKFLVMDPAASTHKDFSLQFDCIRFIPITE